MVTDPLPNTPSGGAGEPCRDDRRCTEGVGSDYGDCRIATSVTCTVPHRASTSLDDRSRSTFCGPVVGAVAARRRIRPGRDGSGGPQRFDLLAPLPEGTTVLEASAGTGKTYAIVGLATRFVAEGVVDLSQLLLVTFSRAATQELRERTRNRFAEVASALADPDVARERGDRADPPPRRRRRPRLAARAIAAGAVGLRRRHHLDHARVLSADAR